jgi:uncharacterized glyoxalase superfamily protein PhnB
MVFVDIESGMEFWLDAFYGACDGHPVLRYPCLHHRGDGTCSIVICVTPYQAPAVAEFALSYPMNTNEMSVIDLKAFVPAKDMAVSRQFYVELGFRQNWANEQIAEFQIGSFRFLLQPFYVQQHARNFMMHLTVEDTDAWWRRINEIGLAERYPGITAKAPAMQPWGLRVLFLSDPTGVLWHIAEQRARK